MRTHGRPWGRVLEADTRTAETPSQLYSTHRLLKRAFAPCEAARPTRQARCAQWPTGAGVWRPDGPVAGWVSGWSPHQNLGADETKATCDGRSGAGSSLGKGT